MTMFWCSAIAGSLLAQDINPGPRMTALGNTGVALQDIWSLQSNQAGLAGVRSAAVAVAGESTFLSTGISTRSAVAALPYHQHVFGVSIWNYGFSEYREQRLGLAYSRSFGNDVFASLDFNLHQLSIPSYGNGRTWSVEAGLQYRASPQVLVGAHVSNPNRSSYDDNVSAVIPVIAELGASWEAGDKILLNSGIVKDLDAAAGFRCGMEYRPDERFVLRGGLSTNPFRQFAGFGCTYGHLKFDAAVASHPDLGYSPQIAICYVF